MPSIQFPTSRGVALDCLTTAKYPAAVECLQKDRDELLAFYDFPAEHCFATISRRPSPVLDKFYKVVGSAGDWDGDGSPDYVASIVDTAGQLDPDIVEVRSARDGRLLFQETRPWGSLFGSALLGDLDLDGDQRPDLVVVAAGEAMDHGKVYAFSVLNLDQRLVSASSAVVSIWWAHEWTGVALPLVWFVLLLIVRARAVCGWSGRFLCRLDPQC